MEYARTVGANPWIGQHPVAPQIPHPKQEQFLLHGQTLELFYGGGGAGGKSQAIWYGALQYANVPGYAALILRRTYADLAKPGALMDRSKEYFAGFEGRHKPLWSEKHKRWVFPGGGSITFGFLQHDGDEQQYKSSEFTYIAFDELTDFTEKQYTFLFTRLRKRSVGPLATVPLRMRSASNPGGPGHSWCKKRFVDEKTRTNGRVFIPALMADNPSVDADEYNASLANTDPLTRARIKSGDWEAIEGGRFKSAWFPRYKHRGDMITFQREGEAQGYSVNLWQCTRFGTIDPATSAKTAADWTVATAWLITPRYDLVLLDVDRFQAEIPDQMPKVQSFYDRWKLAYIGIETVASNNALYQLARRSQMIVKYLNPMSQDKLVRATPAMVLAESGRIWLPFAPIHRRSADGQRESGIEDYESELYRFTGDEKKDDHDDCVDCTLAGTMIRTSEGVKPVETIRAGDMVLTHEGRYRPVTRVMNRVAPRVYSLRVVGRLPLIVTENHRLLAHLARRRGRCGGLDWVPKAEWLSIRDGLSNRIHGLTTVWDRTIEDVANVDLLPFAPPGTRLHDGRLFPTTYGGARLSPTGNTIPRFVPVDELMCRIIGYFAAEGSCTRHQVQFSSSVGEVALHAMVERWAKTLGLDVSRKARAGAMSVYFGSVAARNWFAEAFGRRTEKHLPHWAMRLPPAKLKAILTGYLAGGGHFAKSGWTCNTISETLATQLLELSARLGLPATIRKHAKRVGNDQYYVRWSSSASARIAAFTPEWMIRGKQVRWEGCNGETADQTHVRLVTGRLVGRIRSIEEVPGPVKVYNLAVAEDESYVANGTVVHNCLSYATYCRAGVAPAFSSGGGPMILGV